MSAGTPVRARSVSTKVTVTVSVVCTVEGVSSASVAAHVTVVVPTGKIEPDAWSHVTATGQSSSEAVGIVKVTAAPADDVACTGSGLTPAVMARSASITVMVSVVCTVEGVSSGSVAVQVTVVVPTGKVSPDAWSQVTATEPSSSEAVGIVNVTAAPAADVACTGAGLTPGLIARSVSAPWTVTPTVAELLVRSGSVVLFDVALAMLLITVPFGIELDTPTSTM